MVNFCGINGRSLYCVALIMCHYGPITDDLEGPLRFMYRPPTCMRNDGSIMGTCITVGSI